MIDFAEINVDIDFFVINSGKQQRGTQQVKVFRLLRNFVGKFLLVRAAFEAGSFWAGATAIAVSLLTLLSMIKIFNGAFWGERPDVAPPARPAPSTLRTRVMVGLPLAVGVATIVLGIGASGLLTLAGTAADVLVDPTAYLTAVSR